MRIATPLQGWENLLDVVQSGVDEPFVSVGINESFVNYDGWLRDAGTGVWSPTTTYPATNDAEVHQMTGVDKTSSLYMAVGPGPLVNGSSTGYPKILTSTDGKAWFSSNGNRIGSPLGIAAGNGQWVMPGKISMAWAETPEHYAYRGQIQASADNGANWAGQDLGIEEELVHAHWSGSSWVAVGNRLSNYTGIDNHVPVLYTSPDAANWTKVDPSSLPGYGSLHSVAWGNGAWVAVGSWNDTSIKGYRPVVFRSTDGTNWTRIDPGIQPAMLNDIAWSEKNGFLAVGHSNASALVLRSFDGLSWESLYEPFPGMINAISLRDRSGSPNRTKVAMVGDSGAAWIDTLLWPQTTGIRNYASKASVQGSPLRLDVTGRPFAPGSRGIALEGDAVTGWRRRVVLGKETPQP